MAAANQDIATDRRSGKVVNVPLAAATKVFTGTMGARNPAGYGVPAADAAGLHVVGIVQLGADNTSGAAGAVGVDVEKTTARMNNSATHPLDITKCEQPVYVEDDNTVSASGGTNNVVAGVLVELDPADPTKVWVDFTRKA